MPTHHHNSGNVSGEGILGNDFTCLYITNIHLSIGPTCDQFRHAITSIVVGSNTQSCVLWLREMERGMDQGRSGRERREKEEGGGGMGRRKREEEGGRRGKEKGDGGPCRCFVCKANWPKCVHSIQKPQNTPNTGRFICICMSNWFHIKTFIALHVHVGATKHM